MRNLIFDMDGTLADTAMATIAACGQVRHAFGLPALPDERIYQAIGIANPVFYEVLYPEHPAPLVHTFGQEVEDVEEGIVWRLGSALLFPGIVTLLETASRRGIRMYVASTGDKRHVDAVLKSTGIEHYFDQIACGEPEKVEMVARMLSGQDKCDWAMVGDKSKDWQAAKGNGILAIAAGYGYCDDQEQKGFDIVAHTPMDVLTIVEGGTPTQRSHGT